MSFLFKIQKRTKVLGFSPGPTARPGTRRRRGEQLRASLSPTSRTRCGGGALKDPRALSPTTCTHLGLPFLHGELSLCAYSQFNPQAASGAYLLVPTWRFGAAGRPPPPSFRRRKFEHCELFGGARAGRALSFLDLCAAAAGPWDLSLPRQQEGLGHVPSLASGKCLSPASPPGQGRLAGEGGGACRGCFMASMLRPGGLWRYSGCRSPCGALCRPLKGSQFAETELGFGQLGWSQGAIAHWRAGGGAR
jgi:hypothetical protein